MSSGLEDVAGVVASLSRAAGNALDPTSILARTMAVLEPVVSIGEASLWRTTARRLELVAAHPATGRDLPALDLDAEQARSGAVSLALSGPSHLVGRLVVQPAPGASFDSNDEALLDIAASQIAGALDRAELFAEVMELERLKTDFVSRVSHELRTPITIINGFLETLIAHDEHLDRDQRLHMLDRSRAASLRLGDLIEELLILSRIESGVLTPQPEPLVIGEVLDAVRAASLEPDQVIVSAESADVVVTDRSLLGRALGLLADNAVKYGGVAELSARTVGDRWLIEVRDRGPGFPEDVRDTAFEMFTRSKTSSAVPGLGVGLAIARTLIEILDGTVVIDSTHPGPGALIRVSLPH